MSLVTEILFYRGALVNMPTLPIGMPAFATDTHELFVGTLTGNAKIGVPRISDGNYGDITVSVGGTVYTINAGAISLSDLAPIATQQILGRATAGIGPVESFSWLTLLSVLASTPNSIPVWNGSLWTELVPGTAAAGVLKSGGGAPSWAPIATYAFEERQTQGTNSGTFTQGVWQPRQLNTTVINSDGLASLSANVVTLPAGKYVVRARVPAVGVNRHQSRLLNFTDTTVIAAGSSSYANSLASSNIGSTDSTILAYFTLASSKGILIQHQCETTAASYGFGAACNFGPEIYTQISIERVP